MQEEASEGPHEVSHILFSLGSGKASTPFSLNDLRLKEIFKLLNERSPQTTDLVSQN